MSACKRRSAWLVAGILVGTAASAGAQEAPPSFDPRIFDIVEASSPERIEHDIRMLAGFGTRNTMSDTLSDTRGIGAARRWIKAEFDKISEDCGGCLDVSYMGALVEASGRIT